MALMKTTTKINRHHQLQLGFTWERRKKIQFPFLLYNTTMNDDDEDRFI